jgi:hypothetical protein
VSAKLMHYSNDNVLPMYINDNASSESDLILRKTFVGDFRGKELPRKLPMAMVENIMNIAQSTYSAHPGRCRFTYQVQPARSNLLGSL